PPESPESRRAECGRPIPSERPLLLGTNFLDARRFGSGLTFLFVLTPPVARRRDDAEQRHRTPFERVAAARLVDAIGAGGLGRVEHTPPPLARVARRQRERHLG